MASLLLQQDGFGILLEDGVSYIILEQDDVPQVPALLLQEDGFHILLEDGVSALLLEAGSAGLLSQYPDPMAARGRISQVDPFAATATYKNN